MADAADGGGSDWEVVSLTASTYAAAPGPISSLHADSPLLLPNPPAPPAHFFMSQHFNLPKQPLTTHLENSGCQELESGPAAADGDAAHAGDLNMPSPENYCQSERDDVLVLASPAAGNGLQVEGGGGGGEEPPRTTTPCSLPDAIATAADATDGTATVASAAAPSLPAHGHAAPVAAGGVAASLPCSAGQAWWEKTFSFPRDNGTQPLAFRFVFVAGKLQLQGDHLTTELGVHSQTQKISCAVTEPIGQVKGSMLGGGSPVAQQG